MTKFRTPEQLRAMINAALAKVGKLTPEIEEKLSTMAILPREQRPKPEAVGMSEKAMLQVRAEEVAWFLTHPSEHHYYRRIVPGEFPPDITAEWCRVDKVDPGAVGRVRTPVVRVVGARGLEWRDWTGAKP